MAAPRRGLQAQSSSHYHTPPPTCPPSLRCSSSTSTSRPGTPSYGSSRSPASMLEGVVEYKSLPSGAFVNAPTDEEGSRHARMIAVGVLVPLSYGRLGRAWRHAEALKDLAARLAVDRKQTSALDEYWDMCRDTGPKPPARAHQGLTNGIAGAGQEGSSQGGTREGQVCVGGRRADAAWAQVIALPSSLEPEQSVGYFWAVDLPHTEGRIVKEAHLNIHPHARQRGLVYNISVLANIPFSVFDLLDPSAPAQRLRPLFTIGVHDIPFLMADSAKRPGPTPEQPSSPLGSASSGWIACTTDSILAMKDDLWDVLITMPQAQPAASSTREKVWPTVESPKGVPVRATQRDLRRFRTLKAGLRRVAARRNRHRHHYLPPHTNTASPASPSLLSRQPASSTTVTTPHTLADAADKIVEPVTWAALAYSGFIWWASAGEQRRSDEAEEAAHDNGLLADLIPGPSPGNPPQQQRRPSGSFNVTGMSGGLGESTTSLTARRATTTDGTPASVIGGGGHSGGGDGAEEEEERARVELGIITYFHQEEEAYTDLDPSRTQSEDDEGEESEHLIPQAARVDERAAAAAAAEVRVDSDALAAMGLDVWSNADAAFVREVVALYFDRRARVEGKGVEVCGLRVC
ncbi:hypothetical protein OPQ81_008059 [Rhizoctonia solani]|nr:hypothetical protein OPQ81_008059 [Rhizoctonia solani]